MEQSIAKAEEISKIIGDFYKDGCQRCGTKDRIVLCAHHTNPKQKRHEIHDLISSPRVQLRTIRKEIAKCIPLCRNCHMLEHASNAVKPHMRRGSSSIDLGPEQIEALNEIYQRLGMDDEGVINLGILLAREKLINLVPVKDH